MKRIVGLISLVLLLVLFTFAVLIPADKSEPLHIEDAKAELNKPLNPDASYTPAPSAASPLTFFVIGDVHTNAAALENAVKDMRSINPKADLLVMNGDIVDQGLDEHYSTIKNSLRKLSPLLPKTVIKNIGNHEFYNYDKGPNSLPDIGVFISKYLDFSGEDKVYHDKWIKGCHFISLGSEQSYTPELGSVQAFIPEEQQKWLKEELSEDYAPGRPIFVFLHQPLNSTSSGQRSSWIGVKQNNEVLNILAKYPEVILFSSHTHTYIESNNLLNFKEPFPDIHTGAVNNPLKLDSSGKRNAVEGSQGLYVELKGGKLAVKARDLMNKKWIEGAVYTRDLN